MLDLGGADAVGERAERAVGRGMAVAAHERRAGQREALLGADDVDDALPLVELVEVFEVEEFRVLREIGDLRGALRIGIGQVRSVVGTLWSTTSKVFSGARMERPDSRSPSNACGLVTSWTRWRSI